MTAKQLLEEIKSCNGPCGRACVNCPDNIYLNDIAKALENLIQSNEDLSESLKSVERYVSNLNEKFNE